MPENTRRVIPYDPSLFVIPYDPSILEREQELLHWSRLTPEQQATKKAWLDSLHAREVAAGLAKTGQPDSKPEKYMLLSEVCRMFKPMTAKAIRGFCRRHGVPTIQEPRRFRVAIVPFLTAYAQDTNVRTDEALKKRVRRDLEQQGIRARMDEATNRFFEQ
jgi:hypothetical protein